MSLSKEDALGLARYWVAMKKRAEEEDGPLPHEIENECKRTEDDLKRDGYCLKTLLKEIKQ